MNNDLASIYLRLATLLLRNQHEEWARAMLAELEHVDEAERTNWALGCLIAAIQQRFVSMQNGTLRVSRSILLLELIVCFLPLTWGWLDVVFGDYFLDSSLDAGILGMMLGAAVIGLIGPIGLFLTARAVTRGVGLRSRTFGIAMIVGVVAYAAASVILRLVAGPGAFAADVSFIVLMIALPAIGIAHLMYLATPASPPLAAHSS